KFIYFALFASLILISNEADSQIPAAASVPDTTVRSPLRLKDVSGNPYEESVRTPLFLSNPSNITTGAVYDPDKNEYMIFQKVGSFDYRNPVYMSPEEYRKYQFNKEMREYWEARVAGETSGFKSGLIPQIEIGG